ncbi:MAG: SusC/RagA family TonB-linked outer membrane protein, partial [Sphingobacterium sp.]|nr:SusC/RagA family TonB-linked outer membrane protein [Sphingobacterium sp.]
DDRYFLSGSFRQDRTSRLATAHQVGSYPSISGAWKISSESFFNVPFIDNLKLKAAWGQIGNIRSVSAYAFDVPLSTGTTTPMGKNGVLLRHFAVSQKSNPDLVWEGTETFDVGLDLSMFRKFTLNIEYYQKKTKGLLYENSVDPHSGYAQGPISNIGDVMNRGMEFSAGYNNQFGDWKLNLNANLAFNKNELLNLDGYNNRFIQHPDNVRSVLLPYRSEAGQSLYSYYLVRHAGIFNSKEEIDAYTHEGKLIQPNARPGDLKFIDQDGDGNIDDDDRVYMGSAIPKFNYGFSANTSYKNFDLSILTYGVYGTKIFNGYKYTAYNAGMQGYNLDSRVLNAWTPSNTDTDIPVLSTRDPNSNFGTASDWYLESGDYFRVKNITLGYALPTSALQKLSDQLKARIYFSAENPFTFTSYSGIDPEVGRVGLDVANYPLPRTFTAGININF